MNKDIEYYVEKHNLKEYLQEEDYKKIKVKTFEKGEYLMMSGMEKRTLYFFVEGLVKITLISSEGDEMLLELLKPFDIFGDVECLLGGSIYYNILIKEKSTFLEMDFEEAVKNIKIYELISINLAKKLRNTSTKYSNRELFDSETLVANFILKNQEYFSEKIKYNEFSKLVGLSERHLRRVLKELELKGMIIKKGKRIEMVGKVEKG